MKSKNYFVWCCILGAIPLAIIYRLSLHKDSVGAGWVILLVVFIGTWVLAAHTNEIYWQMADNHALPWWRVFCGR